MRKAVVPIAAGALLVAILVDVLINLGSRAERPLSSIGGLPPGFTIVDTAVTSTAGNSTNTDYYLLHAKYSSNESVTVLASHFTTQGFKVAQARAPFTWAGLSARALVSIGPEESVRQAQFAELSTAFFTDADPAHDVVLVTDP